MNSLNIKLSGAEAQLFFIKMACQAFAIASATNAALSKAVSNGNKNLEDASNNSILQSANQMLEKIGDDLYSEFGLTPDEIHELLK